MGIKDFFNKSKQDRQEISVTRSVRDAKHVVDHSDSFQVNLELTKGIYYNNYPGLTMSSSIGYTAISIPIWWMGLPTPTPADENDEQTAEELAVMVEAFASAITSLHTQCHRDGTIWILPVWDANKGVLAWEFIPDNTVTDIIRNINNGEIQEVWTSEKVKITTAFDKTAEFTRVRKFAKDKITIKYSDIQGTIPAGLKDKTMVNPVGALPVPFANNADYNDVRGHSDYERILPILKQYHDLSFASASTLAKFKTKLVMTVQEPKKWLASAGGSENVNVENMDLVMLTSGSAGASSETASLLSADKAIEPYLKKQEQLFLMIVESLGIPELFFGGMATGNHASVEESQASLVKLVKDKQSRKNKAYTRLFTDSLKLQRLATMNSRPVEEVNMGWGELDSLSEKTKADIFASFSKAAASLVSSNSITKAQLYELWKELYPKATEGSFEEFDAGLKDMAQLNQFASMSYSEGLDSGDEDEEAEAGDDA